MKECEIYVDCWPPFRGKHGVHQGRLGIFCKCVRREAKQARKPWYDYQAGKRPMPVVHVMATLHEDDKMQALNDLHYYEEAVRRAIADAHIVDEPEQVASVGIEARKSEPQLARGCTLKIMFEERDE